MKKNINIRAVGAEDFPQWLDLWDGNNLGMRDEAVTTETWGRLLDPSAPVHGLVAEHKGNLIGLVHSITHPTTGSIKDVCYMQDVFVDPAYRKRGIAQKMVEHLAQEGRGRWARMYWIAQADNAAAQALYKTLGKRLDFTLHMMAL